MWGTFLSEPLPIVGQVGRRPACCLIGRIPIRNRKNLWSDSDVLVRPHSALIRLSAGYSEVVGRLDTRYSPVRRSPSAVASHRHAAPRLACVKPVASVHPEPGSNSPLYKSYVCDRKFLRASVGARHSSSKLGPALASRNLVNLLYRRCSVSERLSKLSRIS